MLRDCGLPQVRRRSPRPERPISVSGRAPSAAPKRLQLGKAAGDERGVRAGAEPPALDDAGGDRQHVLHRAAELHADDIARPVDAQVAIGERGGERLAQRLVGGGERQRGGQAAGDIGGKARPRQHGLRRLRQRLAEHLAQQLAGGLLKALGADDDRLAAPQMLAEVCRHGAHVLGRRHHQHHVACGDVGKVGRRAQGRVERHAGQERRVGVGRVDLGDHIGLARPQHHVAAGQPQGLRQGRAPRSAADDADAVEGHSSAPLPLPVFHGERVGVRGRAKRRSERLPLTLTLSPCRRGMGRGNYDVFMMKGLPPPGPLLIHTLLDCR